MGVIVNPTYHTNPLALDAKLTYAMFIPCITAGAIVFVILRNMARGYEFEMNKCYGCDLCDDACPVRLFNAGSGRGDVGGLLLRDRKHDFRSAPACTRSKD